MLRKMSITPIVLFQVEGSERQGPPKIPVYTKVYLYQVSYTRFPLLAQRLVQVIDPLYVHSHLCKLYAVPLPPCHQ